MARTASAPAARSKGARGGSPAAKNIAESTTSALQVKMTIEVPESLRDQLRLRAAERRTTIRGVILDALQAKGFAIDDAEIADGRSTRR